MKNGNGNGNGTTRSSLSAVIKSIRDLLRTDAGVSGGTDRLQQLAWLLFLKWLDDHEIEQEMMKGSEYEPVIEPPYRWRDWAAGGEDAGRMTGDELIEFVNNELIPYLKQVSSLDPRDIRTVVGTIFQDTPNRVRSGYVLRQVVDKVDGIDFNAAEDIHTVSHIYESMLHEVRNSAGDSGEFYTPRPVVRFIIDRLNPKLGEHVLDPACGTGGFLVEAYEHMRKSVRTTKERKQLEDDLHGIDKKSLPCLLAIVNLLLHGIERPNIEERNALQTAICNIQDSDRVDVIATNPPFGGAEEPGIVNNFPQGMRTSETATLFTQFIMAMLKRPNGRCGMVLPNGFLFATGVEAEVKKLLIERFNLHTIVRLPNGVFAPYTPIPTNLLFFEACDLEGETPCTKEVWYYEQPLPEGRKGYTKTRPMQFEEFADCITWWDNREENEHAWRVPVQQIIDNGYNLDIKNPNSKDELEHMPPEQLVNDIVKKEEQILSILGDIQTLISNKHHAVGEEAGQ
jgi:type I restriction enzyme M protein